MFNPVCTTYSSFGCGQLNELQRLCPAKSQNPTATVKVNGYLPVSERTVSPGLAAKPSTKIASQSIAPDRNGRQMAAARDFLSPGGGSVIDASKASLLHVNGGDVWDYINGTGKACLSKTPLPVSSPATPAGWTLKPDTLTNQKFKRAPISDPSFSPAARHIDPESWRPYHPVLQPIRDSCLVPQH